jgi:hypothetical protein
MPRNSTITEIELEVNAGAPVPLGAPRPAVNGFERSRIIRADFWHAPPAPGTVIRGIARFFLREDVGTRRTWQRVRPFPWRPDGAGGNQPSTRNPGAAVEYIGVYAVRARQERDGKSGTPGVIHYDTFVVLPTRNNMAWDTWAHTQSTEAGVGPVAPAPVGRQPTVNIPPRSPAGAAPRGGIERHAEGEQLTIGRTMPGGNYGGPNNLGVLNFHTPHLMVAPPPMIHFEGVPGHPPQITPVAWVLPLVLGGHDNMVVWAGGLTPAGVSF